MLRAIVKSFDDDLVSFWCRLIVLVVGFVMSQMLGWLWAVWIIRHDLNRNDLTTLWILWYVTGDWLQDKASFRILSYMIKVSFVGERDGDISQRFLHG